MKSSDDAIFAAMKSEYRQRREKAAAYPETLEWLDAQRLDIPEQEVAEIESSEESAESVEPLGNPEIPTASMPDIEYPAAALEGPNAIEQPTLPPENPGGGVLPGQDASSDSPPDTAGYSNMDLEVPNVVSEGLSVPDEMPDDVPDAELAGTIGAEPVPESTPFQQPDLAEPPNDGLGVYQADTPQIANFEVPEFSAPETDTVSEDVASVDYPDYQDGDDNALTYDDVSLEQDYVTATVYDDISADNKSDVSDNVRDDQIDYPDMSSPAFESFGDPSQEVTQVDAPEPPDSTGFLGYENLPPMTMQQAKLDDTGGNDTTIDQKQRAEMQYEAHERASDDFAAQLARELTPSIEERQMIFRQEARDYMDQRLIQAQLLRVR